MKPNTHVDWGISETTDACILGHTMVEPYTKTGWIVGTACHCKAMPDTEYA